MAPMISPFMATTESESLPADKRRPQTAMCICYSSLRVFVHGMHGMRATAHPWSPDCTPCASWVGPSLQALESHAMPAMHPNAPAEGRCSCTLHIEAPLTAQLAVSMIAGCVPEVQRFGRWLHHCVLSGRLIEIARGRESVMISLCGDQQPSSTHATRSWSRAGVTCAAKAHACCK